MRIDRTGEHSARAVISADELKKLGLDAESIDDGTPEAVRFLSEMTGNAFPEKGKYTVSVEMIPIKCGGCVFILTRKPQTEELTAAIITTFSAERLIGICKRIKSLGIRCPESSVTGDRYHIRLITRIPPDSMLFRELSEEGMLFPASDSALAKLSEHDRTVIPKNAVEILAGLSH